MEATVSAHPNEVLARVRREELSMYVGKVIPVHIHMQSHIGNARPMMYAGEDRNNWGRFVLKRESYADGSIQFMGFNTDLAFVEVLPEARGVILFDSYMKLPCEMIIPASSVDLAGIIRAWEERTILPK